MRKSFITIGDLLKKPCFRGAKVIAGTSGLNRKVRWAHILEVTEVSALIDGEELILTTGVGWANTPKKGIQFLHQLIHGGATGLCIELYTCIPSLPEEMISLAEAANFPIIVFEEQVRFIDITKEVYEFIHFPSPEQYISICLEKLWNEIITYDEVENYLSEKLAFYSPLTGIPSVMITDKPEEDNVKQIQHHAKKQGIEIISVFIQDIPGTLIVWFDRLVNHLKLKKRIMYSLKQLPNIQSYTLVFGKTFNSFQEITSSFTSLKTAIGITKTFRKTGFIFYDELHVEKLVYSSLQSGILTIWIDEYLRPVILYDQENDTNLLETLYVLLKCKGNKKETAEQLFIVRQTLYHRLSKLEELLGYDFLNEEKQAILEVAARGALLQREQTKTFPIQKDQSTTIMGL
jgi:hypothetical protein